MWCFPALGLRTLRSWETQNQETPQGISVVARVRARLEFGLDPGTHPLITGPVSQTNDSGDCSGWEELGFHPLIAGRVSQT